MTMTNPAENPVVLPPGPPANGNGEGTVPHEVVKQVAQAADAEAARKLAAIGQLASAIEFKERNRDRQETVVAEKKSEFEAERDELNRQNREIDEMKDELVMLSTGKNSERLPFKDPVQANGSPAAPGSDDALQAAFDALPLAQIGVKPALADKLVADGIRNGKDLREWVAKVPVRKIQGVGPKAVENLSELMAVKMLAMKAEMEEAEKAAQPAAAEVEAKPKSKRAAKLEKQLEKGKKKYQTA